MIVEVLSVAAIFVGGCLFVRCAGLSGPAVLVFGWLAGVCLQLTAGLLQVMVPLSTSPVLTLALTLGGPAIWWLVRWRRGRDVGLPVSHRSALWHSALVMVALTSVVVLLRAANLVKWHIDSFTYLMTSSLIANATFYPAVTPEQATKRLIGVPVLHAPAQLSGEFYLRSVTPLLAVATVAALVWFLHRGLGFAILAVLLLVSNNRFIFSAFYLNGHLLVGALMLTIAGCGWLLISGTDRAEPRALVALLLIALPAVVVTRPEGTMLASLALLPLILSPRVPARHRAAALVVLGVATLGWQTVELWVYLHAGEPVPRSVAGMLALGVLLLLTAGVIGWLDRLHRLPVLLIIELGLWLGLAAFAVREPKILTDSVRATIRNVVVPGGRWGSSLVLLGVLVLIAIGLCRVAPATALRFPVTTFLPVALLLAYLRDEGAYRVGQYDSLNRMFMQVVPLAVLYVVAVFATAGRQRRPSENEAGPRRGALPCDMAHSA